MALHIAPQSIVGLFIVGDGSNSIAYSNDGVTFVGLGNSIIPNNEGGGG